MLREAGVAESDYFVAATQWDENNLLASLLARESGARVVVGLYHQPEFLNLMHAVRIDIPLSPRMMIAGSILRMVHRQEIVSLDLVEGGDAEVVEFDVPLDLVPASLAKGLEFDHVVLLEPAAVVAGEADRTTGLRRLYVCLTRAVTSLVRNTSDLESAYWALRVVLAAQESCCSGHRVNLES